VNAHFLDRLADDTKGASENVLPNEDIEIKVSSLFEKISSPLLADLKLDFGKADVYDVYPKNLPDLFKGSQMLVTGRYKLQGDRPLDANVTLTGQAAGRAQKFTTVASLLPQTLQDEFVPRLWATRKIGWLEDQIRLNGTNQEIVDEIIRLAKEFGVLTQYTSFLVETESLADGRVRPKILAGQIGGGSDEARKLSLQYNSSVELARREQSGAGGVAQSINTKRSRAASLASGPNVYFADGHVKTLNQAQNRKGRTFFQAGPQWIDERVNDKQKTIKVRTYSPAYFQLAGSSRALADWMSIGEELIVNLNDKTSVQLSTREGRESKFSEQEMKDLTGDLPKTVSSNSSPEALPLAAANGSKSGLPWTTIPVIGIVIAGAWMRTCHSA
jgi:Ca-activated chloride channel family protein